MALSSGRVQLVLVRARDEQCSLEGQGAVSMPSGAMVLSLDVCEEEAACMAASTSAGEVAIMKVAMCAVHRIAMSFAERAPTVGWPMWLGPRKQPHR